MSPDSSYPPTSVGHDRMSPHTLQVTSPYGLNPNSSEMRDQIPLTSPMSETPSSITSPNRIINFPRLLEPMPVKADAMIDEGIEDRLLPEEQYEQAGYGGVQLSDPGPVRKQSKASTVVQSRVGGGIGKQGSMVPEPTRKQSKVSIIQADPARKRSKASSVQVPPARPPSKASPVQSGRAESRVSTAHPASVHPARAESRVSNVQPLSVHPGRAESRVSNVHPSSVHPGRAPSKISTVSPGRAHSKALNISPARPPSKVSNNSPARPSSNVSSMYSARMQSKASRVSDIGPSRPPRLFSPTDVRGTTDIGEMLRQRAEVVS